MHRKYKIVALTAIAVWTISNNVGAYLGMKNFQEAIKLYEEANDKLMVENERLVMEIERLRLKH